MEGKPDVRRTPPEPLRLAWLIHPRSTRCPGMSIDLKAVADIRSGPPSAAITSGNLSSR
jgi:hypothetical protein